MSPPYFFRIDEIGESGKAKPQHNHHGFWYPSTDGEAHVRKGGGISGKWFYCDGQRFYEVKELPEKAEHFKTMSMYYGGGSGLWVLEGDALKPPEAEVWHPLRFDHDEDDYSSYVSLAGEHSTLRLQGAGWPSLLLPDIYHTTVSSPNPDHGGLTGELPILLGLIAFSTAKELLYSVLPTTFLEGQWQVHVYGRPRTHRRGIIVYVYTCPAGYYEGAKGSTKEELEDYEEGEFGKYYH